MPPGVHQPSLQQLQALEQNHAGFDAQVRALGEILELDVSVSRAHTDYSSRCKSGNGRLDRGLRWLLSKLQASGSAGTEYVFPFNWTELLLTRDQGPSNH